MDNVVNLASRARRGGRGAMRPVDVSTSLAQAKKLLLDTIDSLTGSDDADGCHLAAVEKIESLLSHVCADESTLVHVLPAMSLVELARLTLAAGPDWFESESLTFTLCIAEALEAAETRLGELSRE